MAILEGGVEEHMDVRECLDDASNGVSGYVSINVKGPAHQIHIRSGDKFIDTFSPIKQEQRTAADLPDVLNKPTAQAETDERIEELHSMKTGNTQTLGSSSPDTFYPRSINQFDHQGQYIQWKAVSQKKDAENHYPSIDNEERIHTDLGFRSPAKVVSISRGLTSNLADSPGKKKYKTVQEHTRKKKGNGHGKEQTGLRLVHRMCPYPKWMNIPISEIGKYSIDIEGRKHHLQVRLVPVVDVAGTKQGQQEDGIAEHGNELNKVQTIRWDGSIDRPPESSLGIDREYDRMLVTYPDAIDQQPCSTFGYISDDRFDEPGYSITPVAERSISDAGENTMDQPLDLSVKKPLDLSVDGNTRQSSTRMNDGNSLAATYNVASMSTDVRAESNVYTDQYRDRALSSIGSYTQDVVADEAQDLNLLSSNVSQFEAVNNGGNLPCLSTLTLESSDQQDTGTVAVQDSAVSQEVLQSLSGQQHIIDLLVAKQVTLKQLVKLYYSNQNKAAVKQWSTSTRQCTSTPAYQIPGVELPLQENVQARSCQDLVVPSDRMSEWSEPEQVIPIPAMPNLYCLELANTEGRILEKEVEHLKNRLKEKVLQNRLSKKNIL